jgi:hypothetical protein
MIPSSVLRAYRDQINARAEQLHLEIRTTLEGSRTPVPSSPGNPPARRTGRLMESLQVLERATTRSLTATVGHAEAPFASEGPYPAFLEFGTRHVAPRPYVRPSVDRFKKRYG